MNEANKLALATTLRDIDESFLVALANKGLLRRAQKSLEEFELQLEESDEHIIVRSSSWTVWMPAEGPLKAKDDSKASGTTWMIIAATIHLKEKWSPEILTNSGDQSASVCPNAESANLDPKNEPSPDAVITPSTNFTASHKLSDPTPMGRPATATTAPADSTRASEAILQALQNIELGELTKWAGKKLVYDTIAIFTEHLELEVEFKTGLTIRLPAHNIELRVPKTEDKGSKLLDQVLSTASKALHKQWIIRAICTLKKQSGKEIELVQNKIVDNADSPRSRQEILHETQKLLETMLANGVAHPSSRIIERLSTLSMSALAVHLPRVSHLLRMLSEEVALLLNRDAAADTQRLFSSMSWTYSLISAIAAAGENLTSDLAAEARSQYAPVGDIQLAGMGAYPWQTASGFEGISILFWDIQAKKFLTWSASRPSSANMGFDLEQIYNSSVWSGGGSANQLSRSNFTLKNARVNSVGRISTSQQTSVETLAPQGLADIDLGDRCFHDWATLQEYAKAQFVIGLTLRNPMESLVVLEPKLWLERSFDEMQQTFCWTIVDTASRTLKLTLPWTAVNEASIHFLECLKAEKDRLHKVVARIVNQGSSIAIEPITFITRASGETTNVLSPAFDLRLIESKQSGLLDRLRKKFGYDRIATTLTADDEWDAGMQTAAVQQGVPLFIRNAIIETEAIILQIAEHGTAQLNEQTREKLSKIAERLSHCGLVQLALSVDAILKQQAISEWVLRTDYLCQLHWQAATRRVLF